MEHQLHEVALEPIDWYHVKDLFGPSLARIQKPLQARLLRAEIDDLGLAVHWLVAPRGQYLFFAPRYKYGIWSHLTQWYRAFFDPERVQQIKQFARSKKWAYRKLPVLDGLSESLVDFGADFGGWNELIGIEEYVLPVEHAAVDEFLMYLREWERTFPAYLYKGVRARSRAQAEAESRLMTALHTNPLVAQGVSARAELKRSVKLLVEALERWSADDVLTRLSTQDTFPVVQRHDLVPGMPVSNATDWQELYELRVAFLEKFAFPWFYRPALAMLGAEGSRGWLTAAQLARQGRRPLSQPLCPEEFRERVGQVALRLEEAYPILAREPLSPERALS